MTSFQSGRGRYVGAGDLYRFVGVGRRHGDVQFLIPREIVERIAGRAANPHVPEDLFDDVEPILFRMAERAYCQRGPDDKGRVTLAITDLD